ncbi:MAG: DUF721 domain-containing protein [Rhodospirillales bacterium]|nr:DUF721 domain-containing protein [Rhodospirillales bacterium]
MSLRPLSSTVPKVTEQVCSRKYIMLGRLVTHWPEIVGEELASKAHPVKIRYMKKKENQKTAATATLDISVSPADATLLHYRKDLILERINQIFGDRWVSALRFVPQTGNEKAKPTRRKKTVAPSMADKKYLAGMLANIDDPDIYERLENMGTAFLQDKKDKETREHGK